MSEPVILYDGSGRPMRVTTARALEPPAYYQGEQRTGLVAGNATSQPSPAALLREFKSWQAIAARAKAQRLSSLELEVTMEVRESEGTLKQEVIDDHPYKRLLDRPNPLFSRRQTLLLASYWLTQAGRAPFLKVTDGLGNVVELWPLNPDLTEPIVSDDDPIVGWVFHSQGGEITYEFDEVVNIWDPDPVSPFDGLSTLGPQAAGYDTAKFMDETLRSHFQDDATPKAVLVAQTGPNSGEPEMPRGDDRDAFDEDWRNRFNRRRGTNRGLPAVLPVGWGLESFGGVADFGNLREALDYYRDLFFMANAVPRSIVGDVVDANRAAAETNMFVFDNFAVKPQAELITDGLNMQLTPDFREPGLAARFAEFVSPDKEFELRREAQDLTSKVRSINQVREDRGLDEAPWGNDPVGAFSDTPYRPDEEPEGGTDDPTALGLPEAEEETDEEEEDRARLYSRVDPQACWERLLLQEREFAPAFSRQLRMVFGRQKEAVIEELGQLELRGQRDRLQDLFSLERWARVFARATEKVRRQVMAAAGRQSLAALGVSSTELEFDDVVRAHLQRQALDMVVNINATTRELLRDSLVEGVDAGESEQGLAKRVRAVFSQRRSNARTIARTEVLSASSAGTLASYQQAGVARKRWNTAGDEAVRDSHEGTHGQVVAVSDTFILGDGERADGPGVGPGGRPLTARNRINCRCFVSPVLEES